MHIVAFLRSWRPQDIRIVALLAVASGLADSLLLAVVNMASKQVSTSLQPASSYTLTYMGLFAASYYTLNRATLRGAFLMEECVKRKRERLVDRLRAIDYVEIDRLGKSRLYQLLTDEIKTLSQLFPTLLSCLQDLVLLTMGWFYLAWLSLSSTLLVTAVAIVTVKWYSKLLKVHSQHYAHILGKAAEMIGQVEGEVDGFKALRLSQHKNQRVLDATVSVSSDLESAHRQAGHVSATGVNIATVFINLSLGMLVLVLPYLSSDIPTTVKQVVATVLFLFGPLGNVVSSMTLLVQLDTSLGALSALEAKLEEATSATAPPVSDQPELGASFDTIEYRGMTYHYRDDEGEALFTSGPWDFTLRKGELVFVVGGNGSGKSTFLQLLCGLYTPDSGTITVDSLAIGATSRADLRERFSAVFADFHLFDRFYGREDVDPALVNGYLADLGLSHKVQMRDGAFTTLDLSSGQRKRLAMAAALVDDKPIYIFDEWTADQDSSFRQRFYQDILPGLKARGKTCVVVTHDDRYWSYAERLVKLDLGKIVYDGPPELEAASVPLDAQASS